MGILHVNREDITEELAVPDNEFYFSKQWKVIYDLLTTNKCDFFVANMLVA